MPPVPSNSVFQASPVVVEGLSLDKSIGKETVSEGMQAGGGSEAILLLNMQTIGIRNEQTVKAIVALARRKELGGPGGANGNCARGGRCPGYFRHSAFRPGRLDRKSVV